MIAILWLDKVGVEVL